MKIRTRVIAAAGAVAMAGSMAAVVAPSANATITQIGHCGGSVTLDKITPHLGDQTVDGTKIAGGLAKNITTKAVIGGKCVGVAPLVAIPVRPGDTHIPQPTGDLHGKAQAVALLGNASCASGATATAADANKADAWPESGTISFTFNETYVDLITSKTANYTMKSNLALLGFNTGAYAPDSVDVGGVNVNTGVGAGLTVYGTVWEDPVLKAPGGVAGTDSYNTGYNLDLADAAGCADGTAGNANIAQVLSGGGFTSSTSVLGTTNVPGVFFQTGE